MAQKFQREFERTIHEMDFVSNPPVSEGAIDDIRLNYIRFKELLVRLGMISELTAHVAQAESQESTLIFELWQILKTKNQSHIQANELSNN